MSIRNFQPPDLTEVNAALTKAFSQIQGLHMYTEAEILAIKADAFDVGFTTGAGEHTHPCTYPSDPRINPYRG